MRITVLSRGGMAVYGPGRYDAKADAAVVSAIDGETVALKIEYPSSPSAMTASEDGISAGAITISGNVASLLLSDINCGGSVTIGASVGGENRAVKVMSETGAMAVRGVEETAEITDYLAAFEAEID